MSEEIIINIPLEGIASGKTQMTAEAHNIKGPSCIAATDKLMKDLATAASSDKTPEYYQKREEALRARG